jgi:hypothetical protein
MSKKYKRLISDWSPKAYSTLIKLCWRFHIKRAKTIAKAIADLELFSDELKNGSIITITRKDGSTRIVTKL